MKRIIALVIALVTVFSVLSLAACAEKNTNTEDGENQTQTGEPTKLDNLPDLVRFADALEAATIQTIEDGVMTGDLRRHCLRRHVALTARIHAAWQPAL